MIVKYDPEFIKAFKKLDIRIRKSFKERIALFAKNPQDSHLNNHSLQKELTGLRSIDVTNDYRAVFEEVTEGEEIYAHFIDIGTHEELYG